MTPQLHKIVAEVQDMDLQPVLNGRIDGTGGRGRGWYPRRPPLKQDLQRCTQSRCTQSDRSSVDEGPGRPERPAGSTIFEFRSCHASIEDRSVA